MRISRFAFGCAVVVAVAASVSTPARAQDPDSSYINIGTYTIAFGVGDTRRFTQTLGWFGMGWDGQWPFRSPHLSKGLSFTLQDFANAKGGTTNFPSGAVTGHQTSEILMMSLLGNVRWYPGEHWGRGLYVGLGAGGEFDTQYYNIAATQQLSRYGVHVAVAPDVGYITQVIGLDMVVNARFLVPNSAGSYLGGGPRSFQYVALSFGIAER